ncbi:MAG: hypothetical protein QOG65_3521 [Actinomycetota bacterium]|nr:hypothetical protein [Actinomycetota bacterium]
MSWPSTTHVKAVAIVVLVVAAPAGCSSSHHASQAASTTEVAAATTVPTTVASTSATGRIAGVFEFIGGGILRPGQSPPVATIVGTVTAISASSGRKWQTRSGLKGYSLAVPPGSYRVSGTGVAVGTKSRFGPTTGRPVVVATGRTTAAPLIIAGY